MKLEWVKAHLVLIHVTAVTPINMKYLELNVQIIKYVAVESVISSCTI